MSDTNPNAYRVEAAEKRQQIAALAAEANDLEAKAKEAEIALGIVQPEETESEPEAEPVDIGTKPEKSGGLFSKS